MATKGRILIVDDDPDFVKTTKMILLSDGYEVLVANDGKQGLEKIKEVKPDMIMLDIMMESIFEGFSLMGTLRTSPEYEDYQGIPVLMVSSVRADTGVFIPQRLGKGGDSILRGRAHFQKSRGSSQADVSMLIS